jgi:hypothetical protein
MDNQKKFRFEWKFNEQGDNQIYEVVADDYGKAVNCFAYWLVNSHKSFILSADSCYDSIVSIYLHDMYKDGYLTYEDDQFHNAKSMPFSDWIMDHCGYAGSSGDGFGLRLTCVCFPVDHKSYN